MQVPAQVVDQRGALGDEALAVVDEQTHVALAARQARDGQGVEALAGCGPGDRDGGDRVGLAAGSRLERRVSAISFGATRSAINVSGAHAIYRS